LTVSACATVIVINIDEITVAIAFDTIGIGTNVFVQALYSRLWGSGFLPSRHQGIAFQTVGDPVLFLSNPPGVDRNARHKMLDFVARINREQQQSSGAQYRKAR